MKFILLISLKDTTEDKWSLVQELQAAGRNGKLPCTDIDGVFRVGLLAYLFDETKVHGVYVQVCTYLIQQNEWPYCVIPVDEFSILGEGKCEGKFQAILERNKVQGNVSVPKAS